MRIRQIYLHELPGFIESEEYKSANILPITRERALSQSLNPRADKNDIVLTIAYDDNNNIISYVGALPDLISNKAKIVWNSCWYAHTQEGRNVALPLFLQFVKNYNGRVIFQDLTPHTTNILKTLPGFTFISSKNGYRFFFRFVLSQLLVSKYPYLKYIKWLLRLIDTTGNLITDSRLKQWTGKRTTQITIETVEKPDADIEQFINSNNKTELIQRGIPELEWILNNKWVKESDTVNNSFKDRYHFTYILKEFGYYLLKFIKDDKLVGFIILKHRDKNIETPYVYVSKTCETAIAEALIIFITGLKANTLTTYNQPLLLALSGVSFPVLYRRRLKRDIVIGNALLDEVNDSIILQDGDGDGVFT